MKTTPEWINAAIRYAITILGIILVTNDVLPQTVWDQIAAATVSFLTATYGVIKTRENEIEHELTLNALGRVGHGTKIESMS